MINILSVDDGTSIKSPNTTTFGHSSLHHSAVHVVEESRKCADIILQRKMRNVQRSENKGDVIN